MKPLFSTIRKTAYLFVVSAVACGKGVAPACFPESRHALAITVIDSVSLAPLATASVVATDSVHSVTDSIQVGNADSYPVFAGTGPGEFLLTVTAPDYRAWHASVSVGVASDVNGCTLPRTQSVRAKLQRTS